MTARETETIFHYLLDALARRKEIPIDDALPIEVQEDLRFAQWMHSLDFSEESQVQHALRRTLEKQVNLVTSAEERRHPESQPAARLNLPALLGLVLGGISMLTAALLLISRRQKEKLSDH